MAMGLVPVERNSEIFSLFLTLQLPEPFRTGIHRSVVRLWGLVEDEYEMASGVGPSRP